MRGKAAPRTDLALVEAATDLGDTMTTTDSPVEVTTADLVEVLGLRAQDGIPTAGRTTEMATVDRLRVSHVLQ